MKGRRGFLSIMVSGEALCTVGMAVGLLSTSLDYFNSVADLVMTYVMPPYGGKDLRHYWSVTRAWEDHSDPDMPVL